MPVVFCFYSADVEKVKANPKRSLSTLCGGVTSGTISRYTPVYLIFNQEIAVDRMVPDQLRDLVKIKPETVGEFAFENNRTIVFKPSKSFERDTRYEVKADLSEWFDTERKDKYFSFRFSTQPLLLRANLQSVDINRKNENGYDIVCSVFTPDREIPETVESLVRFSESECQMAT